MYLCSQPLPSSAATGDCLCVSNQHLPAIPLLHFILYLLIDSGISAAMHPPSCAANPLNIFFPTCNKENIKSFKAKSKQWKHQTGWEEVIKDW